MFRSRWPLIVATAGWLAALATGQLWLLHYQSLPEHLGVAPGVWPAGSSIRPAPGRFTLLIFLHPRCPCARASLEEVSRLSARYGETTDAYALLVRPPGAPEGWELSGLRPGANTVPGVTGLLDEDGREADRFGAETSGLVLLYDPHGRLSFEGGITTGRGHQGENPGLQALRSRLAGTGEGLATNDVFGCPLFGDRPTGAEGRRE
jgi:hypothetical protein